MALALACYDSFLRSRLKTNLSLSPSLCRPCVFVLSPLQRNDIQADLGVSVSSIMQQISVSGGGEGATRNSDGSITTIGFGAPSTSSSSSSSSSAAAGGNGEESIGFGSAGATAASAPAIMLAPKRRPAAE